MDNEITVAMPVYNASKTIMGVLERLTLQKIPNLRVLIYDNGSIDGTIGLLEEIQGTGYFARKHSQDKCALNLTFFRGLHKPELTPYQNAQYTRHLLAKMTKTEYIFFLDHDVILPYYALPKLLEDFKQEKNCAFMGIRYEPDTSNDHIMLGATIWKTNTFKELPEYKDTLDCDCNFSRKSIETKGLKARYHPYMQAQHIKYF